MAALFHAWEVQMFKNLHSWKIRSETTRLSLAAPHTYDDWIYLEIDAWKDHAKATQEFCKQKEWAHLDQQDNCLYMLAHSLVQAIEQLEKQQGRDISKWSLSQFQVTHYEHQPFSEIPGLRQIFGRTVPYQGHRRTVFQSYYPFHQVKTPTVMFASVLRFYTNMGDFCATNPELGTAQVAIDFGNEGSVFSKHYGDWLYRFLDWEYDTLDWS